MTDKAIPFMFLGSERVYRVIGTQGDVYYGMNVCPEVAKDGDSIVTFAFACLNTPEDSAFTKRGSGSFRVYFTPESKQESLRHSGYRLNKITHVIGKNLSMFSACKHLHDQLPAMREWLDSVLDAAGIMPLFNDTSEIFEYFFGVENKEGAETYPLDLKPLEAVSAYGGGEKLNFEKYGYPQEPTAPKKWGNTGEVKETKNTSIEFGTPGLEEEYVAYLKKCAIEGETALSMEEWLEENDEDDENEDD